MSTPATLPDELRGELAEVPVAAIDWPEERLRIPDLGDGFADLVDSIARQGLQQPIGVKRAGPRWLLIWGRRRLEAYRANRERLGASIAAVVCP